MNWIRLLKNIPLRFNEERSDQLAYKLETYPDGYRRVFISPEIGFLCPKHWLVIAVWKFHAFGRNGRSEMLRFLKLAEGCGKLLDVGASAGIFSALFKVSRDRSEIVGIEPDRLSFDLFAETMEDNKRPGSSWRRERVLIGDKAGTMRFFSTGFGGWVAGPGEDGEPIPAETLAGLCERLNFCPDLIKIDIESFEYEALTGSLDWLKQKRPRIFLELHWKFLLQRGKDPAAFLRLLESAGLKLAGGGSLSKITAHHLEGDGGIRLALDWN